MATCPRCGGALERYELWGREQSRCADCGYVGVPVEHASDRDQPEPWGDAIRRFQDREGDHPGPTERRGAPTTVPEVSADADASPTVEVVNEPTDPPGGAPDDDGSDESSAEGDGGGEPAGAEVDAADGDDPDVDGDGADARRRRKKKRER